MNCETVGDGVPEAEAGVVALLDGVPVVPKIEDTTEDAAEAAEEAADEAADAADEALLDAAEAAGGGGFFAVAFEVGEGRATVIS